MCMAMVLTSCVKHELYNTGHPDQGALVVTADFGNRSKEANVPSSYIIRMGDVEQTVQGETNVFGKLLDPMTYTMLVYNNPDGITVDGTVATVNSVASTTGDVEIEPRPDYLFGSYMQVSIAEDDTTWVEVKMKQYIKLLNINLNIKDGDTERIASVTCSLSGVESEVDLSTGMLAGKSAIISSAMDVSDTQMSTYFRILGIVPTEKQILTIKITYDNDDEDVIESDVCDIFNNNDGSIKPLNIVTDISLPSGAGFSATIDDWQKTDDDYEAK